jgi:hypothetical protein
MQRFLALALLLLVLAASPAFAEDDLGSEAQTAGYGRLFGLVGLVVGSLVALLVIIHIVRGFIAEASRGKKIKELVDILDDLPKQKRVLYLGEKVPEWKVGNRAEATAAALKLLARADDWFDPKYLGTVTEGAFKAYKSAVERRSSKKVAPRLGDRCLEELVAEIKRLRKKGEYHVFGEPEITSIEIVHVEAPRSKDKQTFAALVSARSRDFFADEKSGEVLRGDKKLYIYQEFLCFRRTKERWMVERIRPAGDMDYVLHAKNVLTQADLDAFTKTADPDHLREFAAA